MSFSYKELRNERQWKASTGLSQDDFFALCNSFAAAYEKMHGVSLQQAADNLKQEFALSSYQDCLFFLLFQLKNALTQDCLGPVFGMDGSSAQRNFKKYVQVLEQALKQQNVLPRRSFASVEEFTKYLRSQKEINLDVSEYPIERPADEQEQKQCYSGKKKAYP